MKKCYLVIASLVLITTLLGACGNKGNTAGKEETIAVEKTGMPIVKEKINMTMMAPGGEAEWDELASAKALAELTGINFDYITPPSTDFEAKLNLAFASGELPDVIFGAGSGLSNAKQSDY